MLYVIASIVFIYYVAFIMLFCFVFFFKQKTAYEMRISDWSSDVCSSDLPDELIQLLTTAGLAGRRISQRICDFSGLGGGAARESDQQWCGEIFHVRPLLKCGSCAICRPEPQRPFALQQDQRHRGRIVQNATRPESTAHPALRRRAFPDHPTGRANGMRR